MDDEAGRVAANNAVSLALRSATRYHHERVDEIYSRFDLSSRADYRHFLTAHAVAQFSIEDALDAAGAGEIVLDWTRRKRGTLLREDLRDLDATIPSALPLPPLRGSAEVLGALYVVEGARLGGAVLRRKVPAATPVRFLGAPSDKGAWRRLLATLEDRLAATGGVAAATDAAISVFLLFEEAARHQWSIAARA